MIIHSCTLVLFEHFVGHSNNVEIILITQIILFTTIVTLNFHTVTSLRFNLCTSAKKVMFLKDFVRP